MSNTAISNELLMGPRSASELIMGNAASKYDILAMLCNILLIINLQIIIQSEGKSEKY